LVLYSCMFGEQMAKSTDVECPQWAEQGECTNNPLYVNLHCPEHCHRAIGWNPWLRQRAGIDRLLPLTHAHADTEDNDVCVGGLAQSLFGAAEIIRHRLVTYLNGGASVVNGMR
jgi:hypothetical protein